MKTWSRRTPTCRATSSATADVAYQIAPFSTDLQKLRKSPALASLVVDLCELTVNLRCTECWAHASIEAKDDGLMEQLGRLQESNIRKLLLGIFR
jgi:hypothetical protein